MLIEGVGGDIGWSGGDGVMVRLHAFDSDEVSSQVQSHICPSQKPVGRYVYSRKIFEL